MKVFEVTTTVEIDEGVLDDFKSFGSALGDLVGIGSTADQAKDAVNTLSGTKTSSGNKLDVTTATKAARDKFVVDPKQKPKDKPPEVKKDEKESVAAFKKWLRADGPGRTKFARPYHPEDKNNKDIPNNEKRTVPPGPQEYGNAIRSLYAKGYPLRAIEVLKVWKSANLTPQELTTIKSAAAAQAKAIGLN